MQPSNDQFERLRELLESKSSEQPAADYFEELPTLVRERIESLPPPPPPSSFERVMAVFEMRPVVALAYGVAICGGVFAGFRFSETMRQYPLPKPEAREWIGFPLVTRVTSQAWPVDALSAQTEVESIGTTGVLHGIQLARGVSGPLFVAHGSNTTLLKAAFQP